MGRQTHCLGSIRHRYAFHFKQNLARTHHANPVVGSAFAFTHTGFGRLLGNGLVRKQTDPDFAATLHETGHGHAAGFDLPVGDPARLEHFQSEISESQLAATPCLAAHASALLLAILNFLWHQHKISPWPLAVSLSLRTRPLAAIRVSWPAKFRRDKSRSSRR